MKKFKWLIWGALVVVICLFASKYIFAKELHPLSAEGMTMEERAKHDSYFLDRKLLEFNLVKSVEVDHNKKLVKLYSSIYKDERRREDMTKMLQDETNKIIIKYTEKLTIDDFYKVEVYSKDGNIISVK